MRKKRLGLALSGGGARAFAHIGVLKLLEEAAVTISFIGGSSMGGMISALYASGMSAKKIEEEALSKSKIPELIRFADPSAFRRGLLEGRHFRELLVEWLHGTKTFRELKIPLSLSAVDINSSKEVAFNDGELLPVTMATCAFPGIFPPVDYMGYRLVDGGTLNNLPVERVRELGADFIVAVDVLFQVCDISSGWHMSLPAPGFFEEFYRAEMILLSEYSRLRLERSQPEILISPPIPRDIGVFVGFTHAEKIIAAGETAARHALPMIRALLD